MCGIAGYFGEGDERLLMRMVQLLLHRGPDDQGTYIDTAVGIANTRLSIIDLEGGHQPLCNEDGTVWVSFNGEIFNFREERSGLLSKGHLFRTNSDTEVLVHLYEEYGIPFLDRLNGMFAIAIWDARKHMLILARDYVGMKPLYYRVDRDGVLWFASEIKALIAGFGSATISVGALADLLTLGYVPNERTVLEGVWKLRPATALVVDRNGRTTVTYSELELRDPGSAGLSECSQGLERILKAAVESWHIADVPVGAYLSGGVDSSIITALAVGLSEESMLTFTAWFGPDFPHELAAAASVAEVLGVEHRPVLVDEQSVIKRLPKIAWAYDEPIGDAAVIPTFMVSAEAARHVKVVLAGEGADELFAGYPWHRIFSGHRFMPGFVRTSFRQVPNWSILDSCPPSVSAVTWPGYSLTERYIEYQSVFRPAKVRHMLGGSLPGSAISEFSKYLNHAGNGLLSHLLLCDVRTLLAEDFLMKSDKASMANSVEERNPYLDKRLLEYSLSIPPKVKLTQWHNKLVLRNCAIGNLPKSVMMRRKRGYGTPVRGWIRGEVGDFMSALIPDSEVANSVLNRAELGKLQRDRAVRYKQFWLIGAIALWEETLRKVGQAQVLVPAGRSLR